MHHAKFHTSQRLQRLYYLLSDRREHSTLDIIHNASIAAVNSAVSELRENGFGVKCRRSKQGETGRFFYRLTSVPSHTVPVLCQYCKTQYGEKGGFISPIPTHGICPECVETREDLAFMREAKNAKSEI